VLRSYGPLGGAAIAFLLLAALVQPLPREKQTVASGRGRGPTATGVAGGPAGVTGTAAGGAVGQGPGSVAGVGGGDASYYVPAGAKACADRSTMIPGDPYSPPCYAFDGDNGGATSRGVTSTDIVVSIRELEGPSAAEIFTSLSGEQVNDSPESTKDTLVALTEYFNEHFQFYGRKIRIEIFKGQGNGASELLGGAKEKALADAIKVSDEIGAFVDLTGITLPYANALSEQHVVNLGAPYPSRNWFVQRSPYAWSFFPDGTSVVEASSSWIKARLVGSNADFAGPAYRGKPRKYAVVAPENAEYQESVQAYIAEVQKAGFEISLNLTYKLDLNSMPNQASNIIAQLKDAGITSVLAACDPVMLAIGLAPKANEQDYQPEWITAGLAFVDQDIVSQLIDERQWGRAFGIAYNAEPEPLRSSLPYAAYKSVRPNDEPAFAFELAYYQMYMLAIGLQMAGPDLTPESFEQGMFAYPGGLGPLGSWKFGPGDYSGTDDVREIWWDPDRVSIQNSKPGAWVQLDGGARYLPGHFPDGPAPFFSSG
jgi:hypothetical protein